jgi:hypothetical protein
MALNDALDRREFTRASLLALLSGVAITVSGCSEDASTNPDQGGEEGVVNGNHGHRAFITSAQLTAGGAVTLNIQGSASHPHTVDLSTDQIRSIAGGQRVTQNSTTDQGHDHAVTFN